MCVSSIAANITGVVDSSVRTYHCGIAGPSSELTWQGLGGSWEGEGWGGGGGVKEKQVRTIIRICDY